MSTEPTSERWGVLPQEADSDDSYPAQVCDSINGITIAVVKNTPSGSNATDIARIMAAAPELLEACKRLLGTRLETDVPIGIRNAIKEAVAKAEGKTEKA